jgi:hypothetical protein
MVASKRLLDWSPEQISGWLTIQYPDDESLRVSHETIYRSLFVLGSRSAEKRPAGGFGKCPVKPWNPGLAQFKKGSTSCAPSPFLVSTNLRDVLAKPTAIHEARALLAQQIGKFTLERVSEGGKTSFKADGQIDFFGEDAFTHVDGAGGLNRTTRAHVFSLPLVA